MTNVCFYHLSGSVTAGKLSRRSYCSAKSYIITVRPEVTQESDIAMSEEIKAYNILQRLVNM
jgi:hypothetical protein